MTNSTSPLLSAFGNYESVLWFDSSVLPGVRYRVRRVSVGRRIELARRIREIGRGIEFLQAGNETGEKLEAGVLAAEIDREYLTWGLETVEGLTVDGEVATPGVLVEKGPLALGLEIVEQIKAQCGLSEFERKN